MESSQLQNKANVKDEILQNLENQKKLDEEINDLRKQWVALFAFLSPTPFQKRKGGIKTGLFRRCRNWKKA